MTIMTPREIVHELDRHIIGQDDAKRAVAIALRNRWRRMQLAEETARRDHAQEHPHDRPHRRRQDRDRPAPGPACHAPFIKVEATKFTEVGYVGRDVESIVRDLADASVKMLREQQTRPRSSTGRDDVAEDRILDALLPEPAAVGFAAERQRSP